MYRRTLWQKRRREQSLKMEEKPCLLFLAKVLRSYQEEGRSPLEMLEHS
jgi:hypothetical protein